MNSRFPTRGSKFNNPVDDSFDNFDDRIGRNDGRLKQVARNLRIVNTPNPGADILARSAQSAENTYASYSEPQITAGEMLAKAKIKPNEQFPFFGDTIDIDKQLNREAKQTAINASKERINQSERRLSIAEHKQKNPNLKFIPVKGGNIMAFNPQTGDSEDTGIATNTLTEAERLRITQENAMTKQNDAQAAANEKPPQPSQLKHAIDLRIQEAINRNPEWKDYIDTETGMVAPIGTGASRWTGSKGLDEATRSAILDTIYGNRNSPTTPINNPPENTPTNTTPTNVTPTQPNQPVQRIRIQMPNGTKGMWRADKPLPEGAVRIQ